MQEAYREHNEHALAAGSTRGHFLVDLCRPGHMTACLRTFQVKSCAFFVLKARALLLECAEVVAAVLHPDAAAVFSQQETIRCTDDNWDAHFGGWPVYSSVL